jgi:hypothetical protein
VATNAHHRPLSSAARLPAAEHWTSRRDGPIKSASNCTEALFDACLHRGTERPSPAAPAGRPATPDATCDRGPSGPATRELKGSPGPSAEVGCRKTGYVRSSGFTCRAQLVQGVNCDIAGRTPEPARYHARAKFWARHRGAKRATSSRPIPSASTPLANALSPQDWKKSAQDLYAPTGFAATG